MHIFEEPNEYQGSTALTDNLQVAPSSEEWGEESIEINNATFDQRRRVSMPLGGAAGISTIEVVDGRISNELDSLHSKYLKEYAAFSPIVDKLLSEITADGGDRRKEHLSYLGSGVAFDVFHIHNGDKDYVAKFRRTYDETDYDLDGMGPDSDALHDMLVTASCAQGIPHLEQIVAVSPEKGIVISERIPGEVMTKLTDEDHAKITDEQLDELVDTFRAAAAAGVVPELENPENLLYDPSEGFGLIDLDSKYNTFFMRYGYVERGTRFDVNRVSRAVNIAVKDSTQNKLLTARIDAAFYK